MASAVQLSFSLRTSANVKSVHLLGSWDNYKNQLPLSKDSGAPKPGSWRGTFRFQGQTLKLGQRYWYYYIVDGYHVSHDPAKEFTTEPTTGRKLNILDVPGGKGGADSDKRSSLNVAHGRALSPGKIQHPRPSKPYESRRVREADYSRSPSGGSDVDDLTDRLGSTYLNYRDLSNSPPSSFNDSSSSSNCSDRSSPSSLSSLSDHSRGSSCRCERYGVTRKGDRIKLDCGGKRCGYGGDSSSGCSSESSDQSEESESEEEVKNAKRRSVPAAKAGAVRTVTRAPVRTRR